MGNMTTSGVVHYFPTKILEPSGTHAFGSGFNKSQHINSSRPLAANTTCHPRPCHSLSPSAGQPLRPGSESSPALPNSAPPNPLPADLSRPASESPKKIWWWISCVPMFSNVFECFAMCSNVFQCPPMCSDVLQCPPMCSNLFQCVPMFQNSSIRNADTPLCFKLDLKLKKEHRWVGSLLCLYPMCKIILLSLTATSCPTYITKSITISSALSTTSSLLCPKTFHKNFDFTIQRKPSGTSPWGFRDLEQAAEFLRSRVKLGCGTSLSFYSSACLLCLLVPCGDDPLVLGGAAGRTARWQDIDGYGICGISYSIYSISGPCRRRTIGSRFSLAGCPGLWGQGFQMTSIDNLTVMIIMILIWIMRIIIWIKWQKITKLFTKAMNIMNWYSYPS